MDKTLISFALVTTDHKNEGEEEKTKRNRVGKISATPRLHTRRRKKKGGREKQGCYSLVWISFGQRTEKEGNR